ncbi:hypothetical protein L596_028600 [Steinernema carpocapsae]|uniref:Uncharacterized protein n=1 Tax=Steinernema carpocapsae TaxID=34508 RepID=A0A4U5LYY4_STECR|nr:hypothetical protein L596_028600 [Steinernema carpocapsae]
MLGLLELALSEMALSVPESLFCVYYLVRSKASPNSTNRGISRTKSSERRIRNLVYTELAKVRRLLD